MKYLEYINYDIEDNHNNNRAFIFINIEEYTNKHIRKYVKTIGKTLLRNFFNAYVKNISNQSNLIILNDNIIKLKQSFNIYIMDVYYDTEYLYKNYSVDSYVVYANKKLNLFIKDKIK